MLGIKRVKQYRGDGVGASWPQGSTGVPGTIKGVFGARPFNAHIATVGYDYDFHRGVDVTISVGDSLYSPLNGSIIRRHYTHFGWQSASHLDEFTLTTPSSSLAAVVGTNQLVLTCARVGAVSFANIDKLAAKTERIQPEGDDWVMEVQLSSTISVVGAIGIGLFNTAASQYIALEYNGSTFTRRGIGTTTFTANGSTTSVGGQTWLRVQYTKTTGVYDWLYSTDGDTWTSLGSEAGRNFSSTTPDMIPTLYWRSGDVNATPYTINVSQFNWTDEFLNIGRFGNWIMVGSPTAKVMLAHFSILEVAAGAFVSCGTRLGTAGLTGFDARSGRILTEHGHLEYQQNNSWEYSRDLSVNPLDSQFLPRTNVSSNVSVVRSTGNSPDAVDSHSLVITVLRADQDFDLNQVTLTGNLTSRTFNWNTRVGLNVDNDVPVESGVYIVPGSGFNENSASYTVTVYFSKAVVGSTFVSYAVLDTQGVTLASG